MVPAHHRVVYHVSFAEAHCVVKYKMFETGDDARGDQTSAGLSGDRGEIADHQRHNVKCAEL